VLRLGEIDPGARLVVADLVRAGGLNGVQWWRRPLVHFLAIGAALFAAKTLFLAGSPAGDGGESRPILITAQRIAELREDWAARTRAIPAERELAALIQAEVDDELLIREARRRGEHRRDSVVQRRLLRNMQFVEGDSERSAAELLDEAYALGMDESDLVVRRRLIQKMQLMVQHSVRSVEPDEAELLDYMARHEERFIAPPRIRLTHVFLSRDRRGDALAADAEGLLVRLTRDRVEKEAAEARRDPFVFESSLGSRSERELAKLFGPVFAAQVLELPTGGWAGPVPSAYGMHLVWIDERIPSAPRPLTAVRREVREALFSERGKRAMQEYMEELRARYAVRIELPPSSESGAR
jgi:parvulin-like peptidyl-prolyl isomerase